MMKCRVGDKRVGPLPALLAACCVMSAAACPAPARATQRQKVGSAGAPGKKAEVNTGRPTDVVNVVAGAYYVPAEFGADVLTRLARSGKVADRQWKQELLEEAFRLAANAQLKVRKRDAALPGHSVDTPAGYLSHAYDRKLDALSLRGGVVRAMLGLNKRRARELFSEIDPKLPLLALSCEDSLVYELSDFYDLLAVVVKTTFSAEEVSQGEHLRFILPHVQNISSAAQVAPLIKSILSFRLVPDELNHVGGQLVKNLKDIPEDDRSFSYSMSRGDAARAIYDLVLVYKQAGLPSQEFLPAFRGYVLRNLQARRCADNAGAAGAEGALPPYIKELNYGLFHDSPLTPTEVKPRGISGTAKTYEYWESAEAKRLLRELGDLRSGAAGEASADVNERPDSGNTFTASDRQSPGWQERLRNFLSDLKNWDGKAERSATDHFHQKQVLYYGLAAAVPSGWARDAVLTEWMSSLEDQNSQAVTRMEWYLHVDHLLQAARKSKPEERTRVIDAAARSKNPALALYASMERLLPPSP